MKKAIIVGLCMLLLAGASYKPLMYRIFNDYEEVCIAYQQNVTAKCRQNSFMSYIGSEYIYVNWSYCKEQNNSNDTIFFNVYSVHHDYVSNGNCIEYQLRRKVDIEPVVHLFEWCEVYPNSEDC